MLGSLLPLAIGRKIGRHYQPKQRNFVVLVTITTFHARCSGAGGRPGSQLRVDQGWDLTTGHYGSKRKEDWTALPATTEELCCFGYFHDRHSELPASFKQPGSLAAPLSGLPIRDSPGLGETTNNTDQSSFRKMLVLIQTGVLNFESCYN
jgi:hypothetical protein